MSETERMAYVVQVHDACGLVARHVARLPWRERAVLWQEEWRCFQVSMQCAVLLIFSVGDVFDARVKRTVHELELEALNYACAAALLAPPERDVRA